MSFLVSQRISRGQSAIAVVGELRDIGMSVASTVLSPRYSPFFSRVVVITHEPTSPNAVALKSIGGDLHALPAEPSLASDSLKAALRGVDILVNTLDDGPDQEVLADSLLEAAAEVGVAVYFPSEFWIDHWEFDRASLEWVAWARKRSHEQKARELLEAGGSKTKVVSVYAGLGLENFLPSIFDCSLQDATLHAVGSPSAPFSVTSAADVGRALAELSIMCMSPSASPSVPPHIRFSGDTASLADVAGMLTLRQSCAVGVQSTDAGAYRSSLRARHGAGGAVRLEEYARLLAGEGKLDYSMANGNDIVNPAGRAWKWKSVKQYLQEATARALS